MLLNSGGKSWQEALQQVLVQEKEINCKRTIDHLYFQANDTLQSEAEHEFAYIREQIYYSPKEVPATVSLGMPAEDERRVRLYAASVIRKVGVLLGIPTESVCIAQNILHRFYFT